MSKPWTKKEEERLRELWASELLVREIGRELGRSVRAIEARAYKLDLPHRQRRYDWTDEEIAQVARLREEGQTTDEIAARLGRTRGAVARIVSVRDMPAQRAPEWTVSEMAEAVALREQGLTSEEIGARIGRTARAVEVFISKHQADRTRYRGAWSAWEIAFAQRHVVELGVKRVAKALGRSARSVQRKLREVQHGS